MVENALNPWLEIPVAVYEDHIPDPGMDQMRFLEKMEHETITLKSNTSFYVAAYKKPGE